MKYKIPNGFLTLNPHHYILRQYKIGEGLEETDNHLEIKLVRGSKIDKENVENNVEKQEGVLTEQLLKVCENYLTSVNVGDLENHNTKLAINHIRQAQERLNKRRKDRDTRGVGQTYKK